MLFICLEIISIAIADDEIALFPVAVVGTGLGMLIGGQVAERNIVMGGLLDPPGTGDTGAITVQQQPRQQ